MKKHLIILLAILGSCWTIAKAQEKGDWGSVSISFEQSALFTSKYLQLEKNKIYPSFIHLGAELRIIDEWAVYVDMGFGIDKAKDFMEGINYFGELDEANNMNVVGHYEKKSSDHHRKFSMGLSYRFHQDKGWRFTPKFGFGILSFPNLGTGYALKELNTNAMYGVNYGLESSKGHNKDLLYYLQFALKTEKKIAQRFSIHLGVGYNLHLNRLKFFGKKFDYYTENIIDYTSSKKHPHELNFNLGISFR